MIDRDTQTLYTPEIMQINMLRDELSLKEKEIQGVKEGRNQVDHHYMNIL